MESQNVVNDTMRMQSVGATTENKHLVSSTNNLEM